MRLLVIDNSYLGDLLMSSPAFVEIVKRFPDAELLTIEKGRELGERYFKTVHTSWDTVGRPDVAITFHIQRKTNVMMLLRRIPLRIGYYYDHGLLNISKLCLNVLVKKNGQAFTGGYRLDEVCRLVEEVFGGTVERKMVWK